MTEEVGVPGSPQVGVPRCMKVKHCGLQFPYAFQHFSFDHMIIMFFTSSDTPSGHEVTHDPHTRDKCNTHETREVLVRASLKTL